MLTPLKLAWRNIFRQKRRTILLMLVVAYASAMTVFIWGMTDGQTQSVLGNQARFLKAPAIIAKVGYWDDPDPDNALPTLDFMDRAAKVPGVLGMAPRLEFFGILRSAYRSQNLQMRGVNPGLESSVSNVPGKVTVGRMVEKPSEVVMGIDLAEKLDVRLGERVVIEASSGAGAQAKGLILVGMIKSDIAFVDQGTVLIHIDDARDLTGVTTATGVALSTARNQEDAVAARVNEALKDIPDIHTSGLTELLGALADQANRSEFLIVIVIFFGLFAALAVTSTMLVSVMERSKEFGMMGAIGMEPPKLSVMVILEAVLTTIMGWLVGLAIGYTLTGIMGYWNILGPLFSQATDAFSSFGLGSEIYTTSKPVFALYAGITVAFAAFFALIIPARKVAKINIVDAMRSE
jgi:ABC-type lipoprotein release transport system permease subunit